MSGKKAVSLFCTMVLLLASIPVLVAPDAAGKGAAACTNPAREISVIKLTDKLNQSYHPAIAIDANGDIDLVYGEYDTSGSSIQSLMYRKLNATGAVLVNYTHLQDTGGSSTPNPWSSTPGAPFLEHTGNWHRLIWTNSMWHGGGQYTGESAEVLNHFFTDNTTHSWSRANVSAMSISMGNPAYAIDSAGNYHYAYAQYDDGPGPYYPSVHYAKRTQDGIVLADRYLAFNTSECGVAVDPQDGVHIAWRNESSQISFMKLDSNGTPIRWGSVPGPSMGLTNFTVTSDAGGNSTIFWNNGSSIFMYTSYSGATQSNILDIPTQDTTIMGAHYFFNDSPLQVMRDADGNFHLFGYGFAYGVGSGGGSLRQMIQHAVVSPIGSIISSPSSMASIFIDGYRPFFPLVLPGVVYLAYSNSGDPETPWAGINIFLAKKMLDFPDVSVTNLTFSDPAPLENDTIQINVTVKNLGNRDAPLFDVVLSCDNVTLHRNSVWMAANGSTTLEYPWNAMKGFFNFSATAELNISADADLSNNMLGAQLHVTGRPDIAVTSLNWTPVTPFVGDTVSITATVENLGETTGMYAFSRGAGGTAQGSQGHSLLPGAHRQFNLSWTPNASGDFPVSASASNVYPYQMNESNDAMQGVIHVLVLPLPEPGYLLRITSPANNSVVNGTINVTGNISVLNGAGWPETWLYQYRVDNGTPVDFWTWYDNWTFSWNTTTVSNGTHTITVYYPHSEDPKCSETITLIVANRGNDTNVTPPNLTYPSLSFSPLDRLVINESQAAIFFAKVSWDVVPNASFTWFINGTEIKGTDVAGINGSFTISPTSGTTFAASTLSYQTNFRSSGTYIVRVLVKYFDYKMNQTYYAWNLTVRNVNTPPIIRSVSPAGAISLELKKSVNMTVDAYDPEGDTLSYGWMLDGVRFIAKGDTSTWTTQILQYMDKKTAGAHKVTVIVSDGEFNVTYSWSVTYVAKPQPVSTESNLLWPILMLVVIAAAVTAYVIYYRRKNKS